MLVGLKIKNFKSIRDAHVRLGPFTCFIGHNGVGKSNLFDAIHFLSSLAEHDIPEAATLVRSASDGSYSPLDLVFGRDPTRKIELTADMIAPQQVEDDFGEEATPSTTLLTYSLTLGYQGESDRLVVENESLTHARLGEYKKFVGFASSADFRESVAVGSRRGGALISTNSEDRRIMLHGDGGSRGRPTPVGKSPLTVVGGTNTFNYPTVLAAKREMSSWRTLHLEPSVMRAPDPRSAPRHVSASGGHIAATLNALIQQHPDSRLEIVNNLRELNSGIEEIDVHSDEVRDQLTLRARVPGVDNWLYGRSLSDGTLRYVALALMLADVQDRAVLCMEEPENGIHPSRIPNLVELLRDYAVDVGEPVADDNPLRQVLINTHSPEVVRQVELDEMIFVEVANSPRDGQYSVFRPIEDTWRVPALDGTESEVLPKAKQRVADFIGGSPVNTKLGQLQFDFGSAR